jgi:hypothetical protein
LDPLRVYTFADFDVAARKLVEIANAVEAGQDGRIFIELINSAFLGLAARRTSTAPLSPARSRWAGCGGMRAGPTLRLRRLCSGRRNLQDFWNAECDLIGPVYCGGICTLNFHSTQ